MRTEVQDELAETGIPAETEEGEGGLSRHALGDKWVMRCLSHDADYSMTVEFVGADRSCGGDTCRLQVSFGPGAAGRPGNMIVHIDWNTLFPVRIQSLSSHIGIPVTMVTTYDDHFPAGLPYPLDLGKEFQVIQTETTTYSMDGQVPVETNTLTSLLVCRVEAVEQIVVPAGTFTCVRVGKYDQEGTPLSTSWKCDDVGHAIDVKYIDHQTGELCELVAYTSFDVDEI